MSTRSMVDVEGQAQAYKFQLGEDVIGSLQHKFGSTLETRGTIGLHNLYKALFSVGVENDKFWNVFAIRRCYQRLNNPVACKGVYNFM